MAKAKPSKTLAQALTTAKKASINGVIKHTSLESKQIEVLKKAGFLTPVIRGWYLLSKPESASTSTLWYVGFWAFFKTYLNDRFGKQGYCLAADPSLDLHVGQGYISRQLTVITKKASNQSIDLPHNTSLILYADSKNYPESVTKVDGVYAMSLPLALCRLSPAYFKTKPLNVEIALKMVSSVSDISRVLLQEGAVTSAGRLAGAYRTIGEEKKADQILNDMMAAGYEVSEINPFNLYTPVLTTHSKFISPYVGRVQALWKQMREVVIDSFPKPAAIGSEEKTIRIILERYTQDAYNSLSIEGYEVTEELIEKIANQGWDPEGDPNDRKHYNAIAARGYYEAFHTVLKSVEKVVRGDNPGKVFEDDLQTWYRKLFSPGVHAGIFNASDLAGYRNGPVYIKGARHVPPRKEAVQDSMDTLFNLLKQEEHPAVRAVLGHFIFVYIHPYMDGNGRIARFLLNLMLISGGYDWTIIRNTERAEYMKSLEAASTEGNIEPFAKFVRSELNYWIKKNNVK